MKDRLLLFIKAKGITQKVFLQSINKSLGYLASFKKGVSTETLADITRVYPDLNTDWLLTGEGEMLKTTNIEINENSGNVASVNNGTMVSGLIGKAKHFVENLPIGCGTNDNPVAEALFDELEAERTIEKLRDEITRLNAEIERKNKVIDRLLNS